MDILENLSYEWSLIDGQGLVRVVPVDTYRTGFVLVTHIAATAERLDYYPELTIGRHKVSITIDTADEILAHKLASEIDSIVPTHDSES